MAIISTYACSPPVSKQNITSTGSGTGTAPGKELCILEANIQGSLHQPPGEPGSAKWMYRAQHLFVLSLRFGSATVCRQISNMLSIVDVWLKADT